MKLEFYIGIFIFLSVMLIGCLDSSDELDFNNSRSALMLNASNTCIESSIITPTLLNGFARDVGASGPDGAWVIGTNFNSNGFRIYQRAGTGWADRGGGATHISVGSMPWVRNSVGNVYRWTGTGWLHITDAPRAADIAVSSEGKVALAEYYIDPKVGGRVRRKIGASWWTLDTLHATNLDIDNENRACAISGNGEVFYWNEATSTWIKVLGELAWDITWSKGQAGVFYIVSRSHQASGNYYLKKWTGTCWSKVVDPSGSDVAGYRISSAAANELWFTKSDHKIYKAVIP